jgi:chloramphenicol O-acetyltransferase
MRDRLGEDASPDRADVVVMGLAPWHSFKSMNSAIRLEDVEVGEDRPQGELDLF